MARTQFNTAVKEQKHNKQVFFSVFFQEVCSWRFFFSRFVPDFSSFFQGLFQFFFKVVSGFFQEVSGFFQVERVQGLSCFFQGFFRV